MVRPWARDEEIIYLLEVTISKKIFFVSSNSTRFCVSRSSKSLAGKLDIMMAGFNTICNYLQFGRRNFNGHSIIQREREILKRERESI